VYVLFPWFVNGGRLGLSTVSREGQGKPTLRLEKKTWICTRLAPRGMRARGRWAVVFGDELLSKQFPG